MIDAVVGVLLAAGRGRRFDPSGTRPKLLAPAPAGPHAGAPLAAAAARNLHAVLTHVVAVVRPLQATDADAPDPQQQRLHELLVEEGCTLVANPDADRGMGTSLAAGVQAARDWWPDAKGVLIALADMPAIRPATIEAVAQAIAQGAPTAAPVVDGERGHPVGFAFALIGPLLAIRGDHGARELLRLHPPRPIASDDRGALLDIDHAE